MQGIWVFADATARDAAVTSPQEGNSCYLKDTDVIQVYSGSSWVVKSGGSSPLTTKGDLYTYSTTDTRLPVGTNGHTLVANSSTSTGLEWAAPASGSTYVGAAVYADNVFQAVSDSTLTAILFPSEDWDTDGFHSTSTNTSRITIPSGKGGKYQITATAFLSANITGQMNLRIYKNGSAITGTGLQNGMFAFTYANSDKVSGTVTVNAVATDYFEIYIIYVDAVGNKDLRYARFSADYLGA
jgi:hypothetical protein